MTIRYAPFASRWLFLISFALTLFTSAHAQSSFVHPGGLHTQADLDRMKARVAAGEQPWLDSWNALLQNPKAQSTYNPAPRANMGASRQRASADAVAAYFNAIRGYIADSPDHTDNAIRICNLWSAAVDQVPSGVDQPGLSGLYAYQFAVVGEILRIHVGTRWAQADFDRFKNMCRQYLYPICHDFLVNHRGTCITHYWANWDAANIAALAAIGVLLDDEALFNEGINYFTSGAGNGSIQNAVFALHPGGPDQPYGLGQWQETGRDQEHNALGVGLLATFCQIAWNQGVDMFGYDNNRLLAGAEYVAQFNLGQDVPYAFFDNCDDVNQYWPATHDRGRLQRPIWELLYNHYVVRRGLSAPSLSAMAAVNRPEGFSHDDHFGYGTLAFTLDAAVSGYPSAAPASPGGLTAENGVGLVSLSWDPVPTANGYVVSRATASGGPYTTLSTYRGAYSRFTDTAVVNGTTYYYRVAAQNQTGTGGDSGEASATPLAASAALPSGWAFSDVGVVATAGNATYSSAGGGTLSVSGSGAGIGGTADGGGFAFAAANGDTSITARRIGASGAAGVNGRIGLMIRESLAPDAKTQTLFVGDLGFREARFGTRATTGGQMSFITGNGYSANAWFRLVRSGDTFSAYQSGDGVTWHLVGSTVVVMPATVYVGIAAGSGGENLLRGDFDHVSVTGGGAAPAAPATLTATGVGSRQIDLSWSASSGASAYTLKRSASSGGPFVTIASNLPGNSYSDTSLEWQTTYYYVVSAANIAGEGANSAEASGTTLAPDIPPAPAKLMAVAGDGRIVLSWSASVDGTSYTVKRSTVSGGPYTVIGTVTGTNIVDTNATNGTTYYYVVSAANIAGESADSAEANTTPQVGPYSYWPFDETSGATAVDAWSTRNGTLASGATWSTGAFNNGVKLNGAADGYVTLPAGVVSTLTDFTISSWVKLDSLNNWARLFDFGTGTTNYMFLTPRHGASGNGVRFAIRTPSVGEQVLNGPALSTGLWTHLAVTHAGNVGILYINGTEVARHTNMNLTPASLGTTTQNWIGKSQFNDPLLNGTVDDFRIYSRALSSSEIGGLISTVAPAGPTNLVATADGNAVDLNWSASPEATSYNVKRASVSGGPYTTIASNLTTASYTDTGATAGGAYYYIVTSRTGAFESTPSAQASVLLPATGLIASGWNGRVDLSWANASDATGYTVKRATASGGPYAPVATPTVATFSDTGLTNGTTYYYVLSATTALGETPDSTEIAATPVSDPVADAWSHGDVGSVGFLGNTRYSGGVYTLNGGGADIWFQADGFQFTHQPLTGDGAIMARVLTQQNTSGFAKAGVMMRENLNTNSRHALINHTPNNVMEFIRRTAPNVNAVATTTPGAPLARWVRLVRSGNSFTAYHAADGFPTWTTLGTPQTISMGTTPYVGLVVSAGNNGVLGQATFDHVNIATAAPVITSATTATGTFGAPFSYTIQVANTAVLYTAADLPPGLSFDADTGVISGAPAATGIFSVTLGAINAMGDDTETLSVMVAKAGATVTLGDLRQYYDGTPRVPTATTVPEGMNVVFTYEGAAAAPIYPGEYEVVATLDDANYEASVSGTLSVGITALVRHAPSFNADVDGSVQVLLGESLSLNGSASVSGDLLVPGTPGLVLNGQPIFVGTNEGPGSSSPSNYTVTLNTGAVLRYLVRRVDPVAMPVVDAPPAPAGTRDVSINKAGQSAGDFATLRNLTLNSGAGAFSVPPGTYGRFTANGPSTFVLGVAGATEPAIYNLQGLTLNTGSKIQIAGPVVITVASGVTFNGSANVGGAPDGVTLRIAAGGLTLNTGVTFNGHVIAPAGTVTLNSSTLNGSVISDRLTLNGSALLDEPSP